MCVTHIEGILWVLTGFHGCSWVSIGRAQEALLEQDLWSREGCTEGLEGSPLLA